MIGITPLPTIITKGQTGPTRSGFDWNVQQAPGVNANRWARRGGSAWINAILCQIVVGAATTLTKITVKIYGTALVTDSVVFTLQKNGVDTGLAVTLTAGSTAVSATGSVSVGRGDYLTMKAVQSGSESQTNFWVYIFASD